MDETAVSSARVRTLTDGGQELYKYMFQKYMNTLLHRRRQLESLLNESTPSVDGINSAFAKYERTSIDFIDFLKRTRSEESMMELSTHRLIFNSLETRKNVILQQRMVSKGPEVLLNPTKHSTETQGKTDDNFLPPPHRRSLLDGSRSGSSHISSHRSRKSSQNSHSSSVGSAYLREKVKAETAKVRLGFAEREALIEKEAAEKKAQLKVIKLEREYTEAQARLRVIDEYYDDTLPLSRAGLSNELSPHKKVEHFLESHESIMPKPFNYVQSPAVDLIPKNEKVPSVSSLDGIPPAPQKPHLRPQALEFVPRLPVPDMFADPAPQIPEPYEYSTHEGCGMSQASYEPVTALRSKPLSPTPNIEYREYEEPVSPTPTKYRENEEPMSPSPYIGQKSKYREYEEPVTEIPKETNTLSDLSKFLMKKDLLLHRLSNFNDKAEAYLTWKASFKNIVEDLNMSAHEEIDLLINYLGPESRRHAESLRIANANNLNSALAKIWTRLEERYGSPELVELSLRQKLTTMPKIPNNDSKRLYELADILAEIQSIKDQDRYQNLMASYDSSAGVNPVVVKLPTYLQNKWTAIASKHKKQKEVMFPPFSVFVDFISDHATKANDPSFDYSPKTESKAAYTPEKSKNPTASPYRAKPITARKTEVNPKEDREVLCPLHNTSHSLNECKAFQKKPLEERKKFMKDKGLCFRCCAVNQHIAKDCNEVSVVCRRCNSTKHCTALHTQGPDPTYTSTHRPATTPTSSNEEVSSKCTNLNCKEFSGRSCAKIVLIKVYHNASPGNYKNVYAIVDDQSNRSFATSEFFDIFDERGNETEYTLSSCAGTFAMSGRRAGGYIAESADSLTKMDLPPLIECNDIPNNREEIPIPDIAEHCSHLIGIANQIPHLHNDAPISILIGRDMVDTHRVLEQRLGLKNSPFAQRLGLGWVLIGEPCVGDTHWSERVNVNKTQLLINGRASVLEPCNNYFMAKEEALDGMCLFEKTSDDDTRGLSIEDHQFLDIMSKEMFKNAHGHWEAPSLYNQNVNPFQTTGMMP